MRASALPVLLLLATACGERPDGATSKPVTIGFSQAGAESAWRTAETRSILDEAKARGMVVKFADAQGDPEKQQQALRSFLLQRVDAILLAPIVETGFEPVLREVRAAKIPVVLVDRGVRVADEGLYATLIAADFVAEGRAAAAWLAQRLGGNARIAELQGTTGSSPALDRARGFAEELAKYPGMKVVKSQSGDFTRARGKEVMEAFLKAEDPAQPCTAVYAHNDDMALGAIQAIEAAGRKPGQDLVVVSIDGVRGAFEAMVRGQLDATVECSPLLGPLALDAVQQILAGRPVARRHVVPLRVFAKEQAAAELPNRRY